MRIGIIIGSIRAERQTLPVAEYVHGLATARDGDVTYELVDLASFDVPLLTSPVHPMAAGKKYDDPGMQGWSDAVDACDGFVFVTPEYNHGVPGGFKNAVDSLGSELVGKPVAFVGHGSVGGVRAIEQWRQIVANFSMPVVRAELNFNLFVHWSDGAFTPEERHVAEAAAMLDQLEALVHTHRG
ncbi:MAG: NAD(P)H-dependent oxidoreductase [Solirubrobacteraceae bacterium]|nr:NAD(P)H-dependent oxidoreductase [Solirubrobacteraceae bacterium]